MGEIKLLRVQIGEKLSFTSHISELCTKASEKVGVLVQLRNLIPCNGKQTITFNSAPSNLLSSSLALLQCIGSEKAGADSGGALRAVYKTRSASYQELLDRAKHCHFDV